LAFSSICHFILVATSNWSICCFQNKFVFLFPKKI
jgi:hypothetical protein